MFFRPVASRTIFQRLTTTPGHDAGSTSPASARRAGRKVQYGRLDLFLTRRSLEAHGRTCDLAASEASGPGRDCGAFDAVGFRGARCGTRGRLGARGGGHDRLDLAVLDRLKVPEQHVATPAPPEGP